MMKGILLTWSTDYRSDRAMRLVLCVYVYNHSIEGFSLSLFQYQV